MMGLFFLTIKKPTHRGPFHYSFDFYYKFTIIFFGYFTVNRMVFFSI
jgi:hypothetical protein